MFGGRIGASRQELTKGSLIVTASTMPRPFLVSLLTRAACKQLLNTFAHGNKVPVADQCGLTAKGEQRNGRAWEDDQPLNSFLCGAKISCSAAEASLQAYDVAFFNTSAICGVATFFAYHPAALPDFISDVERVHQRGQPVWGSRLGVNGASLRSSPIAIT